MEKLDSDLKRLIAEKTGCTFGLLTCNKEFHGLCVKKDEYKKKKAWQNDMVVLGDILHEKYIEVYEVKKKRIDTYDYRNYTKKINKIVTNKNKKYLVEPLLNAIQDMDIELESRGQTEIGNFVAYKTGKHLIKILNKIGYNPGDYGFYEEMIENF